MNPEALALVPLRPLEFLVLAVLEDGPLHGYGIVRRIQERTEGIVRVRPGDLYRVLYRLEKRRILEDVPESGEARRRSYGLTALGRQVLEAEANMLRSVVSGVGRVGRRKGTSPA